MQLSNREKAICLVANAIANFSIYNEKKQIPDNQSMIDFILKAMPEDLKSEVTIEMIDEVFVQVSNAHLKLS